MKSVSIRFLALALLAAPDACPGLETVLLRGVPHVQQRPDFCGEACAEMALRKLGWSVTQDDVFDRSSVDPAEGRGCATRDLARALRQLSVEPGAVWHAVAPGDAEAGLASLFADLHRDLARSVPSIVCLRVGPLPGTSEHFVLVVGYARKTDRVVYLDPSEAEGSYRGMARDEFLARWPLKYEAQRWTVVRLAMDAASASPLTPPVGFRPADYAQHVRRLRAERLPPGFTVVVCPPFVVVGDEAPDVVRRRATDTVAWAVRHLKQAYFEKDPTSILDVWLFADAGSYERHVRKIFRERPRTPFGYYSKEHQALIMNIGTGGGTLVHEIVHPYVAANFPECPDWLNEGLGSLYEQCGERDGRIVGATNWRLAGLQKAIRAGHLPSFRDLLGTTGGTFYSADPGTNYAEARYLCYYLQTEGLLGRYYHAFLAAKDADPAGLATLQRVLGQDDLDVFQRRWEAFVLGLRFP